MWLLQTLTALLAGIPYLGDAPSLVGTAHNKPGQSRLVSTEARHRIDDLLRRWAVKGATVAVVASPENTHEDWTSEVLAFGEADHEGHPVTEDSLFAIASNSKLFTMLAVGMMIENGTLLPNGDKLDWHTKVKDVLPEWKLMDDYASDHVDIVDLLSMQSGMPRHDHATGPTLPGEVIAQMRYLRPSAEIRQEWQYNNLHYTVLSHMIPTLLGVPYIEFVKDQILDPLGITATYNATRAKESGQRTDGFLRLGRNLTSCIEEWKGLKRIPETCLGTPVPLGWWTDTDGVFLAGPAGLIMSGKDMVKWLKELLEPTVLPVDLLRHATSGRLTVSDNREYPELGPLVYGEAQWSFTYRGFRTEGHIGSLPGQASRMIRIPNRGFGLFVVTNDDDYGYLMADLVTYAVLDDMLELEPIDWEERIMSDAISDLRTFHDVPANPRAPPDESVVSGIYHDAGYGNMTLVPVHPPPTGEPSLSHLVSSITSTVRHLPLNLTGPIYLAQMDKPFVSHLVFTHFDGNLFNWTGVRVFDSPEPGVGKVVSSAYGYVGEAVINEAGLGMFGGWWGAGDRVGSLHASEDRVKEKAEVWYDRIVG